MPQPRLILAGALVRRFEQCRLVAYLDIRGIPTIGWGHTGPEVHLGLTWTQAQADAQLLTDLATADAGLSRLLTVALADAQAAPLISMVFNLGSKALWGSALVARVNARDWINTAHEIVRWDHAGQTEVKGLLIRRLYEAASFLEGSK